MGSHNGCSAWDEDEDLESDNDTVISATSDGDREETLRAMIDAILQSALAVSGCLD